MRIVGGRWRGRPVDAPEGRGTRPTTDRMRESIASMILSAQGLDLTGDSVLDAFAGSGAVGLELLSRGAARCTFCERDRRAAGVVRHNCQAIAGRETPWDVAVGDVLRHASAADLPGAPFSVVFLDPPYAMDACDVSALVEALDAGGMLAPGCLVVYERASSAAGLVVSGAVELRSRSHGGTSIDLLRIGALDDTDVQAEDDGADDEAR